MGYTTTFSGAIALGRRLTMAEAKELLEIAASDDAQKFTGIDAYFQWVPAASLQHIVWDGNEKFYKYIEQMEWLCNWLRQHDILANGNLQWQGEENGDTGSLVVTANAVTAHRTGRSAAKAEKPLTLRGLQEMALEQVTTA